MTSQLLKMNARLVSTSLTVYRIILSILESLSGELELVTCTFNALLLQTLPVISIVIYVGGRTTSLMTLIGGG